MAEAVGMSAVNLNASDREREALRRAQRAHEPSMEEILASIRTIIAEEREPLKASESKEPPPKTAGLSPQPQIVYAKGEAVAAPTPVPPPQRAEPVAETSPPKVVWRQPELAPEPGPKAAAPPPPPSPPPVEDDAPLLAPETDKAVASAFDALSANLAARSAELAEGMAREMLRPMLKAWLDANLPGIVERLISAEIERVVRGTR